MKFEPILMSNKYLLYLFYKFILKVDFIMRLVTKTRLTYLGSVDYTPKGKTEPMKLYKFRSDDGIELKPISLSKLSSLPDFVENQVYLADVTVWDYSRAGTYKQYWSITSLVPYKTKS